MDRQLNGVATGLDLLKTPTNWAKQQKNMVFLKPKFSAKGSNDIVPRSLPGQTTRAYRLSVAGLVW